MNLRSVEPQIFTLFLIKIKQLSIFFFDISEINFIGTIFRSVLGSSNDHHCIVLFYTNTGSDSAYACKIHSLYGKYENSQTKMKIKASTTFSCSCA